MKTALLVIALVAILLTYIFFMQPRCPKCKSKDIGLFTFHGKKVFTCHECGHKGSEEDT